MSYIFSHKSEAFFSNVEHCAFLFSKLCCHKLKVHYYPATQHTCKDSQALWHTQSLVQALWSYSKLSTTGIIWSYNTTQILVTIHSTNISSGIMMLHAASLVQALWSYTTQHKAIITGHACMYSHMLTLMSRHSGLQHQGPTAADCSNSAPIPSQPERFQHCIVTSYVASWMWSCLPLVRRCRHLL